MQSTCVKALTRYGRVKTLLFRLRIFYQLGASTGLSRITLTPRLAFNSLEINVSLKSTLRCDKS